MDETEVGGLAAPKCSLIDDAGGVEDEFPLLPSGTIVGRSPGLGDGFAIVGGDDRSISRQVIRLGHTMDRDWSVERIGRNQVIRERNGERRDVPARVPKRIETGDQILIVGSTRGYRLLTELSTVTPVSTGDTVTLAPYAQRLRLDPRQRELAAAMCASALDPDTYAKNSKTNRELAKLLGVDAATLDARVHRLRARVRRQTGETVETRGELVEYLIGQSIVTQDDLRRL